MDELSSHQDRIHASSGPSGPNANQFLRVYLKCTFGPIVQLVADNLLTRGPQSIEELYKHTQLDAPTLKKSLLTLVQQDIVQPSYEVIQARPGSTKKPRPPRVLYTLQVDQLRHRTRFAAYLLWVKQFFGVECEFILQTLLVHGKLSSNQIMDLTCASINEKNRLSAQEVHRMQVAQAALAAQAAAAAGTSSTVRPPPPPAPVAPVPVQTDRRQINEVFRRLISARFIVRANGLNSAAATTTPSAAAGSNGASTLGAGSSAVNQDILQTFLANSALSEKKTEDAAASSSAAASKATTAGKKRKKGAAADEDEDAPNEEATQPAKKKKKTKKELEAEAAQAAQDKKNEEATAARMKAEAEVQASLDRSAASAGDASADDSGDAHILWVVNHQQFLWEFRKKAVADYVSEQISPAAGFLVAQMMQAYSAEVCHKVRPERPPVFDSDAIYQMCARAAEAQGVVNPLASSEVLEDCLFQLLGDSTGFFERKTHPKGYIINFPVLFAELKLKHVQSICRSRWGALSARIFRCLLVHKRLEETQVSEYATAPRKDVRRLLYEMYNAKMISLQEVPRSADRMPAKTFFLWGVNVQVAQDTYLESLYFSWCNLRLRLELETDQAKPILDKVDTSKIITETEKATIEKWKKGADRLECGINQLNQLIMLFQDF